MARPTQRYTITAHHPNDPTGQPLICNTFDTETLARFRGQLADLGFNSVTVVTQALGPDGRPVGEATAFP